MTPHSRKLLPPDYHPTIPLSLLHSPSPNTPPLKKFEERESPTTTTNYTSTCCYNSLKLSPPFDSAMALTVLVLLTALFFMGFFSIYIRRFADESSVDPTRRRNRRISGDDSPTTSYLPSRLRGASQAKGVDPTTIQSLPVHAYVGGDADAKKQGIELDEVECAICLSEFEEREWVKEIPYCGHVFHVECIDTWLSSHVTCPLCRTAKLFPPTAVDEEVLEEREKEVEEGHVADRDDRGSGGVEVQETGGGGEVRLVVDDRDTWNGGEREVGPVDVRRSTSCSWFGERVMLHRSLSF